jgi:non-ribosomal peptide synthase protein (TIGR01720 family)
LEPTPIGVTGEICIGGVGVGRGYLKRPALTAEKFVPDPFSEQPGARMYRTGDAGRYLADGRIEFLGRIDDQVKVRGYRIELGEIEAVLEQHPHVQSAAVVIPEDGRAKRLVGYIIPAGDQEPQTEELRAFVRTKLPEYMTPTQFEVIEAFPLTPNGKVDRKALAAKELGRAEQMQAFVAPSTEVERLLAQVWQAVLRIDQVGIHDNFFQLGGDSILSIQVISQALALGLRLEPRHIFQHPTIAELAEVAQSSRIHAEQGLVVGDAPLTPWQQRFFELYGAEPHIRSQALLLELPQAPQAEMLEAAAHQVVRHHDALRLRFEQREAGWVQYNAGDEATAVFSIVDLSSLPQAEQADAVIAHATDLRAGMDLTAGPLFRVAYFDLGPERSARLLFLIHDLIIDSLSWPILLQDFLATVGMLERSASVQLPPKTTSFRHWAQRLQEYAQTEAVRRDLGYWLDALNSPAAIPPPDFAEAATVDQADASIVRVLTVDETAALLGDASQAYHTEPLDLLLTALCQVFIHRSDAATLLVDIEDDQRQEAIAEDVDISRTAGRFTATYPVALSPADDDHPGEFIKHIKEQLRSIPHAGLGYGLLRYLHEDAEVRRQLQSRPSAPVAFRFVQSPADAIAELPAIRIAPESPGSVRGQMGEQPYALAVEAVVQDGRMQFEWHYDHQYYHPSTISALADEYALALRALIEHCLSPEAGGFTQSDVVDFGWDETDLQDFEDDRGDLPEAENHAAEPRTQGFPLFIEGFAY